MHRNHYQAKSRVIGSYIKINFEDVKCIYKSKNIVNDFRKDFGVNISYDKAWRSREKALDMVKGGVEEPFKLLPSYLYMLKLNNPGTITKFKSDSGNRFKYLFMAIGACLVKFRSKMRPIIVIDACFLKGKYLGSLFVITCKDGNNIVYPIAWGVRDSENDTSWEWFFNKLRSAIGDEIPDVENVHALFYKAAKAYRQIKFHEYFNELEQYALAVNTYLKEAGFSLWARAYSNGKIFDIMKTNIAKCLNAVLTDARKLQIQCLMEYIKNMLQQWFYERRGDASKMGGHIASWFEEEIAKKLALS
ncbi:uncharacterized protein LOC127812749 [Diospyros lotus]|uniref:uncharacterized protein LOC127812749 n=1 Tax=Diospyros lotus TaxID=55363 RepID=UPI002254CB86|nr:uncharacterized protein LOC127812749 [Diospyros lotus]